MPTITKWKFTDILKLDEVSERWEKVRRFFFLRESTYDVTSRCNMRCDGCYYYQGDKQHTPDNTSPNAWRALMKQEKQRGITFIVLAGAEPSLLPEILQVCYEEIPLGCIATNGLKFIPEEVGFKIHISVWGNDETSWCVRKVKNALERQLQNYNEDKRAVFVYTFTKQNIEESPEVIAQLAASGAKVTFNMFSAPVGYQGGLRHDAGSLAETRQAMLEFMKQYPDNILFSPYNVAAHTDTKGLHDLFSCPYPRCNASSAIGLGRSFRQYRTDLTWDRDVACCVPDTDCPDCRHYAAGSAVVTARLYRHATDPETFKNWLDYVDTYLAVWVMGYEKGRNLGSFSAK